MKAVVTMTTIPSRLQSKYRDDIRACLDSLLNQTFDEYEVHMNIPYIYKVTGEEYVIPEWLDELVSTNPKLKYFRGEDYGTFTKMTDTLKRIDNPECVIIVVDDDLVYHAEMVAEQYNNQTQVFVDCAVGYDGMGALDRNFKDVRNHFVVSVPCNVRVNVLQHYKTVSYKRKYFGDDFFTEFLNASWNDDVAISAYMTKRGITKYVTYYDKESIPATLEEWQTRGGVTTFPILRHTQHDHQEGCNLIRAQNISDNFMQFHAKGYLR